MRRNRRNCFLGAAVLVLAALWTNGCGSSPATANPAAMPPPDVEVLPVAQEDVQLHSEWVATVEGSVTAEIQPQVSGYLVRQNYGEGSVVRKGQVLFEIDPRPLQAALDQARAQLAQAQSQVAQAQSAVLQAEGETAQAAAQFRKAQQDVDRDKPLAEARAIAQSQFETELQAMAAAGAAVQASKARVASMQAAVKTAEAAVTAARANVAQAELNLGFTRVRSLIDGIAGVAQTQIGNLVAQDTVLTTVSQVNPLRVYFPISEREYLDLTGATAESERVNLLKPNRSADLELILSNGEVYRHRGRVAFADRQVDAQTGTIRVAASFPNPGNVLRPGQFGRIRAATVRLSDALLIPQRAVTELQGKYQVAVVNPGNTVQVRVITLGPALGSRYIVKDGLKAGERVVVEGIAKAADGSTVNARPAAETGKGL